MTSQTYQRRAETTGEVTDLIKESRDNSWSHGPNKGKQRQQVKSRTHQWRAETTGEVNDLQKEADQTQQCRDCSWLYWPIKAVGLISSTISSRLVRALKDLAKGSLCLLIPPEALSCTHIILMLNSCHDEVGLFWTRTMLMLNTCHKKKRVSSERTSSSC